MDTIKIDKKSVKMIAHRGVSGLECENTCAAFVAAGNRSYFGIETDTHVTSDGQLVIFHDDNTERVSGTNLEVEASTYAELSALRLFDKQTDLKRSDLVIPTLDEYIRICKRYEKVAVLELKNAMTREVCGRIADTIAGLEYLEQTVFISFSRQNCVYLRELLPNAKIQFLTTKWESEILEFMKEHRLDLDILHKRVTAELVELIHANGFEINVWTVDSPERAEELVDLGVDYITSNILE